MGEESVAGTWRERASERGMQGRRRTKGGASDKGSETHHLVGDI